jgi:nucleotide-binding universal stress UspA family protein
MMRVLVAYDGSEGAELAVADLLRAGLPEDTEARVLTIADVWLPSSPLDPRGISDPEIDQRLLQAHAHAAESVHEATQTAIRGAQRIHQQFPKWTVTTAGQAESPAWGIVAEAGQWEADLIVVGSHGRTPLERFFIGSVSYKVAAEAGCSVRVVKPRRGSEERPFRLLIGVDGSEDARRAAEHVISRRWSAGTEVHMVAVVDSKMKTAILGRREIMGKQGSIQSIEDWIEPFFETLRGRIQGREFATHFSIFDGDPKSKLLSYAAEHHVGTIFLGARGLNHGERLYLGTLASAVCARAHCTVEIVRARPPG